MKELIEILIELAEIVYALSDEARFSGGWKAGEVLSRLKALQIVCAGKGNEDETGQGA